MTKTTINESQERSDRDMERRTDRFGIWTVVSGGVTGYRASWLKADGSVRIFSTLKDAQKEASSLNASMNNKFSRATFQYAAKELI